MIRNVLPPLLIASGVLATTGNAADLVGSPAVPGASVPAGTTLKVVADHENQRITSPTAIAFDDQGRILVTETHRFGAGVEDDREHLYWYLDDLAAKTTADRRALHEKWREKLPLEKMTEKSELVRRLADTNDDGNLNESKVFADGFNDVLDGTAAGIFCHEGAVYLACIPKLLMLHDKDDDGRADEMKSLAEGFGVRISLSGHDLNGFTLGPDGRIYGTIGDRGFNLTTKEGVKLVYPNQGAVFRLDPDGSNFEVFHSGLRNPKEIAFDTLGNPFTVDNNSDQGDAARIVYLVEGGDSGWEMEHQAMFSFHRQIGLDELPPSRWMDEKMWHLANPEQPAYIIPPAAHLTSGPSGLVYHPGVGFLESEADHFFICDYRGSAATSGVWSFRMTPEGAGMKLADSHKLVGGVAASDIDFSWDGRVCIADFGGGWKSHEEGRLLSLAADPPAWRQSEADSSASIMGKGMEHRSSAELANLLKHPDARIRLRAQVALSRKDDALKRFADATLSSDPMARIHGIWGLGILARRGAAPLPASEFGSIPSVKIRADAEKRLLDLFKDKDAEIRCQAVRTLVDSTTSGGAQLPIGPLLADPSPRVRFFAALLAGKRKMIGYYGPVCDMLVENNNRDPFLRHAGAYALQHMSPNSNTLRALASHESAAVRLAAVVALRRMHSRDVADFLGDSDPKVADEAIRAVCDTETTTERPAAAAWMDRLDERPWTPIMLRRLLHNSFRIGDSKNAARLIRFAMDSKQPEALRKEAFRLLAAWTKPFPVDQFTGHWQPLPGRDASTIVPLLEEQLPVLLKEKGLGLAEALRWIETYQISTASLDDASLRSMVGNNDLPVEARSKALDLLAARDPGDFDACLSSVIRTAPDEVALNAMRRLVKRSPAAAAEPLEAAIASGRGTLAAESWALLAGVPGDKTDALFVKHLNLLRDTKGISPDAIELMEAAGKRATPEVSAALQNLESALHDDPDPLTRWNVALQGGDPGKGKAIFTSHPAAECMRCHRIGEDGDVGGSTAPDLAGVANRRKDQRYFLESMIRPSAVIAPGFGTVVIEFKNGTGLGGNLMESTADHIDLQTQGRTLRILRTDIQSVSEPVSAMPPMGDLLQPREIRDLVAFLSSLTRDGAGPAEPVTPEPFDPSTLLDSNTAEHAAPDTKTLAAGRAQFIVCGACHGQNGEGTAAAPPLAGSEWVNGPVENLIRIQLRGLRGPIQVKGQQYDITGGMAPLAYQTDEQIAAVLSYVRSSFGNQAPPVTPEEVKALRGEAGKPQLTAADLKPPVGSGDATPSPAESSDATSRPAVDYSDLKADSNLPKWIAATVVLLGIAFVILKLRKNP